MAKIANTVAEENKKLERFKRKSNSTPVKATKEYLKASLEEKYKDKKKAVKGEFVKENTNSKTNVQETNKYDRSKDTTKVNNSNRNSHYNSSSTYKKINDTVKNKKNDQVQIDQEKFNAWMDDNKNRKPISSEVYEQKKIQDAIKGKTKANVSDMQDVYSQTMLERIAKIPGQVLTNTGASILKGYDTMKEGILQGTIDDPFKILEIMPQGSALNDFYKNLSNISNIGQSISINNQKLKDFKAIDENNLSNKLDKLAQEKASDIVYGADGLEGHLLKSLMSAGNMIIHAVGKYLTGGALNPTATMALQNGIESTYENLQKGYDYETSLANGVMKGFITKFTEGEQVEGLTNFFTSGFSKHVLAALVKESLKESMEEGAEYGLNWGLDAIQLGNVDEYSIGALFENMSLGFTTAGLMSTAGQITYQVNTRKQYNQLKADMELAEKLKNTFDSNEIDDEVYNQAMSSAQTAIKQFEETSIIGNAVQFESDEPVRMSVQEVVEAYEKFTKPDVDEMLNTLATEENVNYSISPDGSNKVDVSNLDYISYQDRLSVYPKETQEAINDYMTMDEAHRMLETAFNRIKDWTDYSNVDDYIRNDDNALRNLVDQIENEPDLYNRYILPNEQILDEEYMIADVVDAFMDGTLKQENVKQKFKEFNLTENIDVKHKTFYTPKVIEDYISSYEIANQRVNNSNRDEVQKARANMIIFSHNKNASELLGISQSELNKKVRQWSRYSKKSRDLSNRLNDSVADAYKWSGLENSNLLNKHSVTTEELDAVVKDVIGTTSEYQRKYIVNTMLAIDSHIDYSNLTFEFTNDVLHGKNSVKGLYSKEETKIRVRRDYQNTINHETGHYIDNLWGRELSGLLGKSKNAYLSDLIYERLNFENYDVQNFYDNFRLFMNDITNSSDNRNQYTQTSTEIFARFTDKFVQWVNKKSDGYMFTESTGYSDNFTEKQFRDFVKLLQQKSYLDLNILQESEVENELLEAGIDLNANIKIENGGDSTRFFDKNFKMNRSDILKNAFANLKDTFGNDERYAIIDSNNAKIKVTTDALKHGILKKGLSNRATAFVTENIGTVLKNAYKINEIKPTESHPNGQDVYLSILSDNDGNLYPTRILSDKKTSYLNDFSIIDKLYALKSHKKDDNRAGSKINSSPEPLSSSNIILNDLAKIVKDIYGDTLPNIILDDLGISRPNTDLGKNAKYSIESSNDNIIDDNYDYQYGESLFNLDYYDNGNIVGRINYGVYDDKPNIKMIEVAPEYRRQGIATKLLQELQKKYDGIPISFGYHTEDGGKLIDSVTELVKNPNYNVEKMNQINSLREQSNKLQEELDFIREEMKDLYYKYKNGTITPEEQERYDYVCKREMKIDSDLNDIGNQIYQIEETLSENEVDEYHRFVKLPKDLTIYNLESKGLSWTQEQKELLESGLKGPFQYSKFLRTIDDMNISKEDKLSLVQSTENLVGSNILKRKWYSTFTYIYSNDKYNSYKEYNEERKREEEIQSIKYNERRLKELEQRKLEHERNLQLAKEFEQTAEQHLSNALDIFGTTNSFRYAGYITTDGDLLKLGTHGGREDHRAISQAFNAEELYDRNHGIGVVALTKFLNEGNIRLIPETNGLDLSVEPNTKQRRKIFEYASSLRGQNFMVDISNSNGDVIKSFEYKKVDPNNVLLDIAKHFSQNSVQYSKTSSSQEIKNRYKQYKEINDNFLNSFNQIVDKKDMDADYKELLSSVVLEKIKTGKIEPVTLETLKDETWIRLFDYEPNSEYETYKTILDMVRDQKVSMSSLGFDERRFTEHRQGIGEFASKEDWNSFRRKHQWMFKFRKEGGRSIDSIYKEIVGEYPGVLRQEAKTPYEKLMEIAEYLDNKQEEDFKIHQSERGLMFEMFEEDFNNKIENMIHSIDTKKEISILMSKENIRSNPEKAILNAGGIIPNHDIIRQKYPEFSDLNFNIALLEQYTNGRATDETVKALKEDLIKNVYGNDASQGNVAAKQVDEFLNDSIKYFLAHSQFQTNKEYMSSIASQANELLKSYNSLDRDKIESTYDQVEMKEKAKEIIREKNKKRRISVADAVDKLLFSGANVRMSMFKTLEQNNDVVANGNADLRSALRDTIEMKRFEAQQRYKELLEKYSAINDYIVKDLGIKGKSKESKGMQWFMELHKEDGSPYNQQQLMLDFDYTMKNGKKAYENIMEAAKLQSDAYDEFYTLTNETRENIYGDIDVNNELETAELEAKYKQAKHTMLQIQDELKKYPTEKLEAAYEQAREEVRKLYKQLQSKIQRDENGDSTRRQKLQYRKNYAHHLVKKGFLSSLMGKIDGSSVREVPTYLAGISDDAEPKTGFAKFFSKQTGGSYEADAVNGFAEYIKDASRIIAYDPYIDYLRGFADDIRAVAQDDEMSQFTRYLTDYANDIAGKTGKIDRAVREMVGDKVFGVIKTLNARVKANAILGNIRTATTQIFNIPNALGVLADNGGAATTQDVMKGVTSYMNSILTNQNDDSDASPFITSRYLDVNTQSKGIGAKLENLSNFMLSKGDEISTKMIWNAAYQQALRTNKENPVFYADDLTRRAVAGRGVGEVPLALQSQFMNLVIPFQVETNNAFRTLSSKVKDKKVGSVLTILLANWIFNAISETLYGDRLLFDPIDVIAEAIDDYKEDEEKDELESIKNTIKRLFGETLGNIPGGTYLPMILGWNEDESQNFFGESDPTRYGTGNIGLSVLGSALQDIDKGNYLDAASDLAANFALPGGGKQAQRTIEALQVNGMLPQYENGQLIKEPVYYTESGKVGYVTNPDDIIESPENFFDFAKQVMFGKWAGKNAQEYIDSGFKSMGQTQTNIFDALSEGMNKSDSFNMAKEVYEAKKGMTGEDGKTQFIEYLSSDEFTPEQRNEIYDTYYGDSNLTVRINEFASGCKLDANQTFEVKKILSTTASLKNSSGESVRNSKALAIRKQLDELGLYDDIIQYINDNNLDFGDMGLNKTVGGMTNSEFESEYKSIYGQSYSSKTEDDLAAAYAATFGETKSKGGSKKSSSTKSSGKSNKTTSNKTTEENTFSLDVEKAKIDNILAKVYGGSTSTNEAYKKINNIVKKVKSNKVDSKIDVKSKYSKLINAYLKNHPENAYLFK